MSTAEILQIIALAIGQLPAVESLVVNGIEVFNTTWSAEEQLKALVDARSKLVKMPLTPPS